MVRRFACVRRFGVPLLCAVFASACSTYSRECFRPSPLAPPERDQVQVTFLGVGGLLLRHRTDAGPAAVMTAPLYSNPTFGEIATQPVWTDQRLTDALLRPHLSQGPGEVRAILSGHSHYDHLMDVPYVALHLTPQATLYGNDAMKRLLAPVSALGGGRLVSLEEKAKRNERWRCDEHADGPGGLSDGFVTIGDRIRVWPILSEHSSQFQVRLPFVMKSLLPPAHLWRGDLLEDRQDLPSRPGEWVEGTTLAYVIDFLEASGDEVAFRVYYQDSGTREPFGFPPPCVLKKHPVDLAILCVGGSETVPEHPQALLAALGRPRFVIASHWEDFFNPRQLPLPQTSCTPKNSCCERINGIPFGKPKDFLKKVASALTTDGRYTLPCPDTSTTFMRQGAEWRMLSSTAHWEAGHRAPGGR